MPKDKHFSKFFLAALLLTASIFLFEGCAEMVSGSKTSAGNVLNVSVDFAEPYNKDAYRYVFIYSKQSTINFPVNYYLFVPGDIGIESQLAGALTPVTNNANSDVIINYYYEYYFSTWSDDIIIDGKLQPDNSVQLSSYICFSNNNYFPATANAVVHNSFALNSLSNTSFQFGKSSKYANGFYLQISLNALKNPPAAGETFYFNLLVLDKDRKLVDVLQKDQAFMTNDLNQIKTGSNTNYTPVSGNQDIREWEARIL